jgi:hypothetical protein
MGNAVGDQPYLIEDDGGVGLRLQGYGRLGQGRPLIGEVMFFPNQRDRSLIAVFAEGHRGAGAGFSRADDDHANLRRTHQPTKTRPDSTFTG